QSPPATGVDPATAPDGAGPATPFGVVDGAAATPEALVVATGPVTAGADWLAVAESAEPEGSRALDAAAAVWLFAAGIVLARPAVVAPTPSINAASDQFDNRRTRRSPL